MSLFFKLLEPVNVSFDEFRKQDGELNTSHMVATEVPGPNQALSTGDPPIIPKSR